MLRLRIIQAEFGDCLILQYGTPRRPKSILIDGGPPGTYENHLLPVLQTLFPRRGMFQLAMLSHVDNDHVIGMLDLLADLRQAQDARKRGRVTIKGLWHNAFSQTVDPQEEIQPRLSELLAVGQSLGVRMHSTAFALEGMLEGHQLRLAALALGIPMNPGFTGGVIRTDTAPEELSSGALRLRVVGPTVKNLEKLRKKWLDWLDENEARLALAAPQAAVAADRSVPNISSIMLLVEESGRKLLMTGDGRGSDLLKGLKETSLLDAGGRLHVDVLKMPHHGSARNVTRKFLEAVTADRYIFCANGRDGNPDLSTLKMVVEVGRAQERQIELLLTNTTPSSEMLLETYKPEECGYTLTVMEPRAHEMVVEIA